MKVWDLCAKWFFPLLGGEYWQSVCGAAGNDITSVLGVPREYMGEDFSPAVDG